MQYSSDVVDSIIVKKKACQQERGQPNESSTPTCIWFALDASTIYDIYQIGLRHDAFSTSTVKVVTEL